MQSREGRGTRMDRPSIVIDRRPMAGPEGSFREVAGSLTLSGCRRLGGLESWAIKPGLAA